MVGWHHRLDGHGFEQALGDGEGQGGLVCCSPWSCKESDLTVNEQRQKHLMHSVSLRQSYLMTSVGYIQMTYQRMFKEYSVIRVYFQMQLN